MPDLNFVFKCVFCFLMKHIFLYLTLGVFFSTPKLYSQELPYSISASFGPSFPIGRFEQAGTDSVSKQSAAEPGISATASFSYQFLDSQGQGF